MPLKRVKLKTHDEWLSERLHRGIGGSEAASCVGLSPHTSTVELWKIKTGQAISEDISDDPNVQRGHRVEPALRELFKALEPDCKLSYHKYDILYQSERPWLFATLDGEIVDADGRKGVFEAKTALLVSSVSRQNWIGGSIPQNYYCQCLHQLLATGWDFVRLYAALFEIGEDDVTIKRYTIAADEHRESMAYLLEAEQDFWNHCKNKTIPSQKINI